MTSSKLAFIINGAKPKHRQLLAEISAFLDNYPVQVYVTQYRGHATELAAQAVQEGARMLISAGGDGTLNEVLNGLILGCQTVSNLRPDEVILGVMAMGTGNDFLKNFDSTPSLVSLKQRIEGGQAQRIDVGLAEFYDNQNQPISRYFINIADIGVGGAIAEKLSRYSRWMGANLTYQRAILSTFLSYKTPPMRTIIGDTDLVSPMMSLVVANGKYFGSGLGIAPEADLTDGLLEVVMLKNITIWDYLRQLPNVRRCQPLQHPEVTYTKTQFISIESPHNEPLPIDMDGEFVGFTPVRFSVIPQYVSVL